ncbi:hypothetical protein V1264_004673 [Littorina saxatilis]|uniref:G-protein coupled receptors family 1 profile domain-containing protein n=2 Tax=Littorina saxatilis TaxID=31220 RepID=A0AAN9B2Y6_9CAEN
MPSISTPSPSPVSETSQDSAMSILYNVTTSDVLVIKDVINMTTSHQPTTSLNVFKTVTQLTHESNISLFTSTIPSTETAANRLRPSSELSFLHTEHFLVWFTLNLALAIFIILGNGLTLAAVSTTRCLQTQANMYIVSLALADILAAIYLLLDAVWVLPVTGSAFDDCKSLCLLKQGVLYVCLSSSMITMTCIAVDKLLFVAAPFLHTRAVTPEKTLVVILLCWVVSVMYGSVVSYVNVFDQTVGCQMHKVLDPTFVFYGNTTPVALAVFIITGCYLEIVRIVIKQRKKIQAVNQLCDLDRDSYKKSLRLFLTVLGVFVVCWSPYVVQGFLLYVFGRRHDYRRAFLLLALLNCGLNFFIYAWKNKDFRAAYRRLLVDRCRPEPVIC